MAKAANRRDVFVNRVRGRLTWGADSTVSVHETFNTGMNVGRSDPMKWIILGCFLQPNRSGDVANLPIADMSVYAQLAIGTQDAILDEDDMQVVATGWKSWAVATDGGLQLDWPLRLPIDHPIPVFAQALTIGMDATANNAALQSKEWYYEIQYLRAGITQTEIVEYLAAFGQV